MIEFVFLDMDDTLLDFHAAEIGGLRKTLSQVGLEPTPEVLGRFHVINEAQWKKLETGELTRAQVKLRRFELLFEEFGVDCDAERARVLYEQILSEGHIFLEGAEKLLADLHEKYKLYIVSNGTSSVQRGRIASAGFAPLFEGIFLSEDVGFVKPQKEFFDVCFGTIPNFSRERSIILGDSLTSDILGGINAGIRTCWFNPHGKTGREDIRPDFEISALSQFPALVEQL